MAECILLKRGLTGRDANLDVVTVSPSDILAGKIAVDKEGKPLTGTMTNLGAISQSLNAGGSYRIPEGYHNGSGTVTANNLASQTNATALAAHLLSGQTAWVNGNKITGTMTVNSILNFSAAAYGSQILLRWQNPYAAVGKPFSGVAVQRSISGYNQGQELFYKGTGNNITQGAWSELVVNILAPGYIHYFTGTPYAITSAGEIQGLPFYAQVTAGGVIPD